MTGAGVLEAHRAQRPETDGVRAAGGHDLDGHTAFVDGQVLVGVVAGGPLGADEGGVEGLVFRLIKRTVQVIRIPPAIAGGGEHLFLVQAFGGDDGGHRVVEVQLFPAGQGRHGLGQGALGEGAGGHQDGLVLRDGGDFLPVHRDARAVFHHAGDFLAEAVPVHGQSAAGGHAGCLGGLEQMAAHGPHLQLEQAGSGIRALGFQGVGADQLRKAFAFMGGGKADRLLLVQVHLHPVFRQPEGGFAPGQAGAVNLDLVHVTPSWGRLPSQSRSPLSGRPAGPCA